MKREIEADKRSRTSVGAEPSRTFPKPDKPETRTGQDEGDEGLRRGGDEEEGG